MCAPKSITPHTKFKGEVYILTKEEGGRHTPFFNGYRPQFYFRTTDVTGVAKLPEGREMVMPGDNVDDGDRADHADRDGDGAALRDPRRRPHRRRRRRRRDRRVRNGRTNAPEDPHQAQVVRPRDARPVGRARSCATARRTGALTSGPVPLPTKKTVYTVLRGPHVDKKSREQFEIRIHKRLIDITRATGQTIEALEKLDIPAGVDIEIKT